MYCNTTSEAPVVIVGAGPAGLTGAITLAQYGVDSLIVERRLEPSTLPKATVVSVRTMELLRSWNVDEAVLAGADEVEWRMRLCNTLAEAGAGPAFEVGYPSKEASTMISPASPACVPQDHLEVVLREHIKTLPGVALELNVDVIDVRQSPDGCDVELHDITSGIRRTVAAQYVIGADGAHGVVRERAGIGVRVTDDNTDVITVVFHAPLWDIAGDYRNGLYSITNPASPGTLLPAGQGDRWIFGIQWDPSTQRLDDYTDEQFIERIRTAAGCDDLPVRIERVGSFSFAGAIADRFRNGRIFLAGDAAHRVTPRGGTGMNTAIAGAFDLAWKLGWVLNGWAPNELLDTYETERRPVAEHNVARSLDPGGSRRTVLDELNVDLGGRIRHLWLDDADAANTQQRTSTLDLVGPGLTLFTGPEGTTRSSDDKAAPITTHVLETTIARGLGITPGGGLLVRPDGVPVEAWSSAATTSAHGTERGADLVDEELGLLESCEVPAACRLAPVA